MAENEQNATKMVKFLLDQRYNEEKKDYDIHMYKNVADNVYMDVNSKETVGAALSKLSYTIDEVKQEVDDYDVTEMRNILNTLIYRLVAEGIINEGDIVPGNDDIKGLQDTLNNLIYRLEAEGVIDDNGLDTVVILDNPEHITLIRGMYANKAVYI